MATSTPPVYVETVPTITAIPLAEELLTTDEVAAWLKVAPSTVCRWRMKGKGPRVHWLSSSLPRYDRKDVTAWLKQVAA
ncbi:helix-turn-helix transcriptional regulator [Promicromonospora sp. Populi]|uniref:helix-turn-helix transcriptional regulator n=1 Tax=Promicromonospora sp. Populi TaxID=3239420 RepID=UPI0034E2EF18